MVLNVLWSGFVCTFLFPEVNVAITSHILSEYTLGVVFVRD